MQDIFEMMEDAAEARYYEMLQPDGRLRCGCGRVFDPQREGGPASAHPYAAPVCGVCFGGPATDLPERGKEENDER